MANPTMRQKTLKLQRQLRKLPRRINDPPGTFIKHSGTPIPARMKAEGVKAPSRPQPELMKGYKHRANSLKTTMEEADWQVLCKYGVLTHMDHPGQEEARERRIQMILEKREETDAETRRLLCVSKFLLKRPRG